MTNLILITIFGFVATMLTIRSVGKDVTNELKTLHKDSERNHSALIGELENIATAIHQLANQLDTA